MINRSTFPALPRPRDQQCVDNNVSRMLRGRLLFFVLRPTRRVQEFITILPDPAAEIALEPGATDTPCGILLQRVQRYFRSEKQSMRRKTMPEARPCPPRSGAIGTVYK